MTKSGAIMTVNGAFLPNTSTYTHRCSAPVPPFSRERLGIVVAKQEKDYVLRSRRGRPNHRFAVRGWRITTLHRDRAGAPPASGRKPDMNGAVDPRIWSRCPPQELRFGPLSARGEASVQRLRQQHTLPRLPERVQRNPYSGPVSAGRPTSSPGPTSGRPTPPR